MMLDQLSQPVAVVVVDLNKELWLALQVMHVWGESDRYYLGQDSVVLINSFLVQLRRILDEASGASNKTRLQDVLDEMIGSQVIP